VRQRIELAHWSSSRGCGRSADIDHRRTAASGVVAKGNRRLPPIREEVLNDSGPGSRTVRGHVRDKHGQCDARCATQTIAAGTLEIYRTFSSKWAVKGARDQDQWDADRARSASGNAEEVP
jgi:hypothetical protein